MFTAIITYSVVLIQFLLTESKHIEWVPNTTMKNMTSQLTADKDYLNMKFN